VKLCFLLSERDDLLHVACSLLFGVCTRFGTEDQKTLVDEPETVISASLAAARSTKCLAVVCDANCPSIPVESGLRFPRSHSFKNFPRGGHENSNPVRLTEYESIKAEWLGQYVFAL